MDELLITRQGVSIIIVKRILLQLNLNAVISIIHVISVTRNVKITKPLSGKKKNLMNWQFYAAFVKKEHTINQYLNTNQCLYCESPFNEGCQKHYHLYFDYEVSCKR